MRLRQQRCRTVAYVRTVAGEGTRAAVSQSDGLPAVDEYRARATGVTGWTSCWTPLLERESRSGSSPHDVATDATHNRWRCNSNFYIVTIFFAPALEIGCRSDSSANPMNLSSDFARVTLTPCSCISLKCLSRSTSVIYAIWELNKSSTVSDLSVSRGRFDARCVRPVVTWGA